MKLSLMMWEKAYHEDLNAVYNRFFRDNKKIEITYSQFVNYAYHHSIQRKPLYS